MSRVSPRLLLLLGALIVALRVGGTLSSSPASQASPPAPAETIAPLAALPELEAIDREVDRLRDRLAAPARADAPRRDPFQFADARPHPGRAPASSVGDEARLVRETESAAEPVVAWPVLVAILATGGADAPTYRNALLDAADLVQVRAAGESLGLVVVEAVTADEVTLVHQGTGVSTRLTLR